MRATRITVFTGILLVAACGKVSPTQTSLKWGDLEGYDTGDFLISVLPNKQIEVCGDKDTEQFAISASKKWSEVIGRSNYLKIVPCTSSSQGNTIDNGDGSSGEGVKNGARITILRGGSGTAYAEPNAQRITISDEMPLKHFEYILLHESGHLWGLCDQYAGVENCDPEHRSQEKVENAVMGSSYESNFAEDDITGIKKLADRDDIPSNKIWKDFIAANGTGTPQGNQDIFLFVAGRDDLQRVKLLIATNSSVVKAAICEGPYEQCLKTKLEALTFVAVPNVDSKAMRTVFESPVSIPLNSGAVVTLLGFDASGQVIQSKSIQYTL